jgi:hypothetical protein
MAEVEEDLIILSDGEENKNDNDIGDNFTITIPQEVKKNFRERQILAIKILEIQQLKREYDRDKNLPLASNEEEEHTERKLSVISENTQELIIKAN